MSVRRGLVVMAVGALATALFTAMSPASAQQGDQCDKPISKRVGGWFCADQGAK